MSGTARGPASLVSVFALALAAGGCAYSAEQRAAGWSVVTTENVVLRTSIGPERALELAAELQRMRDTLAHAALRCAFAGKPAPIQVTVLASPEFHDIAPKTAVGEYRHWGITWLPDYAGQIVMNEDLDRQTRQIYQHELTHHLVAACFPGAPLWLNEGMASFLETVVIDDGQVLIGIPAFAIQPGWRQPDTALYRGVFVRLLGRERLPPVDRVTAATADQFYFQGERGWLKTMAGYATAWAVVHLLELGGDRDLKRRFAAFLDGLRRVDADASALFAESFRGVDLQARLDDYLRRGDMPYLHVRAPAVRTSAARVRPMSAGEAHLHWAWLWSDAPAGQEARARVAEHLDAARKDPATRARAHLLAAELLVASRDMAGAEREVTEGLRAAPRDPELLHAEVDLAIARRSDPSAAAALLRQVARTGEQLCAVSAADLAAGHPSRAIADAMRGLVASPGSRSCRRHIELARKALRANRTAAPPGS
jgi:hypothetical protein